ncbi:MAG: N-6 DNA methylase [Clostridia bacterium]|nr:N-6 DNA methylase [Clostridia bacterium]
MDPNIEIALNIFYQREIISREQLLTEILRVKQTMAALKAEGSPELPEDKERLFQVMKKTTEQELGYFPGDRDFFAKIYEVCREVDLIEFTLSIYKNDRLGTVIAPAYLIDLIHQYIDSRKTNSILIPEAEKHLAGLVSLVERYPDKQFTFTTELYKMYLMLSLGFDRYENVKVKHLSIYSSTIMEGKFDYIYTLPHFAGKWEGDREQYITNQTDGIAIENLLPLLSTSGTLTAIVPARLAFAGDSFAKLRTHITDNYHLDSVFIIPEGTFRPYTAIKTYMLNISIEPSETVTIGTITYENGKVAVDEQKRIATTIFSRQEDWRVELMLSDDDENLKKFRESSHQKVKLKEVAEVFRGKSVLKKDTTPGGNISVLNISNIENGQINYNEMDTIAEEERKVKRYELADGDVVLSCRGTAIKSAVFQQQKKPIIASANLIVVRPKKEVMGEYIRIFFESPIGRTLIKSFQRGTTVMNINYLDIMEIELPLLPLNEQAAMVSKYNQEWAAYKKAVEEAETRWNQTKTSIYNQLL